MAYIAWSDRYLTGVSEMDAQHKKWVELLNAFYDRLDDGDSQSSLRKLLMGAAEYADFHFKSEEAFMERIRYPKLSEQKRMHADIKRKIAEYLEKLNAGKIVVSLSVTKEMKDWLNSHILEEDMQYGTYAARGTAPQ